MCQLIVTEQETPLCRDPSLKCSHDLDEPPRELQFILGLWPFPAMGLSRQTRQMGTASFADIYTASSLSMKAMKAAGANHHRLIESWTTMLGV
eukprot:3080184-Amphidinium_carterae.1